MTVKASSCTVIRIASLQSQISTPPFNVKKFLGSAFFITLTIHRSSFNCSNCRSPTFDRITYPRTKGERCTKPSERKSLIGHRPNRLSNAIPDCFFLISITIVLAIRHSQWLRRFRCGSKVRSRRLKPEVSRLTPQILNDRTMNYSAILKY